MMTRDDLIRVLDGCDPSVLQVTPRVPCGPDCAVCHQSPPLYQDWPSCRECGQQVCEAHTLRGSLDDPEDGETSATVLCTPGCAVICAYCQTVVDSADADGVEGDDCDYCSACADFLAHGPNAPLDAREEGA